MANSAVHLAFFLQILPQLKSFQKSKCAHRARTGRHLCAKFDVLRHSQSCIWEIVSDGDDGCGKWQSTGGRMARVNWLGARVGSHLVLTLIHQMNRVNSCNDRLVVLTSPSALSGVLIFLLLFHVRWLSSQGPLCSALSEDYDVYHRRCHRFTSPEGSTFLAIFVY